MRAPRVGLDYDINSDGCWIVRTSKLPKGYGRVWRDGRLQYAHRYAWALANGMEIPDGMTVDHICFQPSCVNPDHLRLLSKSENSARQRRAASSYCKRGHEFTSANTRMKWCNNGRYLTRACRECDAMHGRARNERRRAARSAAEA